MRNLLILSLALALFGCSQTSNNGGQQSTAADTTAVVDSQEQNAEVRLQAIYADVFGWYAKAEKDPSVLQKMPDFDSRSRSGGDNCRLAQRQISPCAAWQEKLLPRCGEIVKILQLLQRGLTAISFPDGRVSLFYENLSEFK